MSKTETENRAKEQAQAKLESVMGMVKALEEAREADEFATFEGEEVTADVMMERIQEDALDVNVRQDWHIPGGDSTPTEYLILLCTGGPAVRIRGQLDEYQQPEDAKLEYQDWFTPWELYRTSEEEYEALLTYAREFYFEC